MKCQYHRIETKRRSKKKKEYITTKWYYNDHVHLNVVDKIYCDGDLEVDIDNGIEYGTDIYGDGRSASAVFRISYVCRKCGNTNRTPEGMPENVWDLKGFLQKIIEEMS